MQSVEERYYTPKEIATVLKVSESTVRRWLDNGQINGFRLPGRGWRVSQTALDEFFRRSSGQGE